MRSVAVFCGANHGNRAAYRDAAVDLGRALVERNISLVYGGGNIGLMGDIASATLAFGGRVIGVIPDFMVERELAHEGLTELVVVDSMHTRKAKMAELAQGFIAMPGGIGTFDELFEILTCAKLGILPYPVGFLDVENYFDPFRDLWKRVDKGGFLHAQTRAPIISGSISELLDVMAAQQPASANSLIKP